MKKLLAHKAELIHIKSMRILLSFCLVLMVLAMMPSVALAQNQEKLSRVEASLKKEQARQKKLQQDKVALEKRLERFRRDMIHVSAMMQKQEKAVLTLQQEQEQSATAMDEALADLDDQRESLAGVISALHRMQRVPPEALLARPAAPIDLARSFGLLEHVVPAVSAQAAEIGNLVGQIALLRQEQALRADALQEERKNLQHKQAELAKMVKQREKLLAEHDKKQQQADREIAGLARQAKDLRDLMAKLERQKAEASRQAKTQASEPITSSASSGRGLLRSLQGWFGKTGNLPVSGEVVTGYGEKIAGGGISQGLRIKAAEGAVVTAPIGGVVRFAGPFRQYKLLVIVQHDNGDHSLFGGMQELYTKTGARVATGEPLGKLPSKSGSGRNTGKISKLEGDSSGSSSLYYERRRKGKPIDPRRA